MSNLKELAIASAQEESEKYKKQRISEREASLDALIEEWPNKWTLRLPEPPPVPAREDFRWTKMTYENGRGRDTKVTGWSFTHDGLGFIYSKEQGMCVVLTCPDCGEKHAVHFYGLSDLGKNLKAERYFLHECHQVVARQLAHAIQAATRATNLSASAILDEALEIYQGFRS